MPPVPSPSSSSPPSKAHCPTLDEINHLHLRYDGPVPSFALGDLRRNPPRPVKTADLCDHNLAQWQALAWRNLKDAQARLARLRAARPRKTRTASCQNGILMRQCTRTLAECVTRRAAWRTLCEERRRRTRLGQHLRTLQAINRAIALNRSPPAHPAEPAL